MQPVKSAILSTHHGKSKILGKRTEGVIETLYIVEGAIDACALATLLKIKGKLTQPLQMIITAGAPHSLLKNRIEKTNPKKIVIATDMDTQVRRYAHSTMCENKARKTRMKKNMQSPFGFSVSAMP